jgi:hypothetical protein
MKPRDTKRQVTTQKTMIYGHDYILRRNPTSRWVDFKTTHQLSGCTQNLNMYVH